MARAKSIDTTSPRRPRVVVVGNSYAATCQIPALLWVGGCDIVAVVGQDLAKAERTARAHDIALGTNNVADAFALQPDLVLIATPTDTHASLFAQAIADTRAAVLVEKPLALTVEEARVMREGAGDRLVVLDHQLRFSQPRRALRELVVTGALGEIRHLRVTMTFGSHERMNRAASWWDERARGGGALLALGSHLVDGALWMLGDVVAVQARLHRHIQKRGNVEVTSDDGAELWLTHGSGARTTIVTSTARLLGAASAVEVDGTRAAACLMHEDELVVCTDGDSKRVEVRLPTVAEVQACNPTAFARCEPLLLRAVLDAVRTGAGAVAHAATLDDGVRVQQVLEAAMVSDHTGTRVAL